MGRYYEFVLHSGERISAFRLDDISELSTVRPNTPILAPASVWAQLAAGGGNTAAPPVVIDERQYKTLIDGDTFVPAANFNDDRTWGVVSDTTAGAVNVVIETSSDGELIVSNTGVHATEVFVRDQLTDIGQPPTVSIRDIDGNTKAIGSVTIPGGFKGVVRKIGDVWRLIELTGGVISIAQNVQPVITATPATTVAASDAGTVIPIDLSGVADPGVVDLTVGPNPTHGQSIIFKNYPGAAGAGNASDTKTADILFGTKSVDGAAAPVTEQINKPGQVLSYVFDENIDGWLKLTDSSTSAAVAATNGIEEKLYRTNTTAPTDADLDNPATTLRVLSIDDSIDRTLHWTRTTAPGLFTLRAATDDSVNANYHAEQVADGSPLNELPTVAETEEKSTFRREFTPSGRVEVYEHNGTVWAPDYVVPAVAAATQRIYRSTDGVNVLPGDKVYWVAGHTLNDALVNDLDSATIVPDTNWADIRAAFVADNTKSIVNVGTFENDLPLTGSDAITITRKPGNITLISAAVTGDGDGSSADPEDRQFANKITANTFIDSASIVGNHWGGYAEVDAIAILDDATPDETEVTLSSIRDAVLTIVSRSSAADLNNPNPAVEVESDISHLPTYTAAADRGVTLQNQQATYRKEAGKWVQVGAAVRSVPPRQLASRSVPTLAALLADTDLVDTEIVEILGHTQAGIGGRAYRYDASASLNNGQQLSWTHDTLPGRLIAVDQSVVRPEDYGAIGDGDINSAGTDDTAALMLWASRVGNANSAHKSTKYEAIQAYRTTDSILIDSARYGSLQIGLADTAGARRTGIIYDGPNGGGPEPENSKAAVILHQCGGINIPSIQAYADQESSLKPNTTGVLITGQDSGQRGRTLTGRIYAQDFGHSWVIGLSSRPVSTWTDTIDGNPFQYRIPGNYTDDIFEGHSITKLRSTGCRQAYMSADTSDASTIESLELTSYNPGGVSYNLGVSNENLTIDNAGLLNIGNLMVLQNDIGNYIGDVNWDLTTDTNIASVAHGLSVGDYVNFPTSGTWSVPVAVTDSDDPNHVVHYHVVSVSPNSFEVALTAGGVSVELTGGSGTGTVMRTDLNTCAIMADNANLRVGSANFEGSRCLLMRKTAVASRSPITIQKLQSSGGAYNAAHEVIRSNADISILSGRVGGHIVTNAGGQISTLFEDHEGVVHGVKNIQANQSPRVNQVGGGQGGDATGVDAAGNGSYLYNPMLIQNSHQQLHARDTKRIESATGSAAASCSATQIVVADNTLFAPNDFIFLHDPLGELPPELSENTPYLVRNIGGTGGVRIRDFYTDANMALTATAFTSVTVYKANPWFDISLPLDAPTNVMFTSDVVVSHGSSTQKSSITKRTLIAGVTSPTNADPSNPDELVFQRQAVNEILSMKNTATTEVNVMSGYVLVRDDDDLGVKLHLLVAQFNDDSDDKVLSGHITIDGMGTGGPNRNVYSRSIAPEVSRSFAWDYA